MTGSSAADSKMLICPATAADIPALRALEQQAETAAHWAEREYDALFAPEAPPRTALVAAEGAELLGFIIARRDPEQWEIENVVVSPLHQRRGIGRTLVKHLIEAAQRADASAVLLEVRSSNTAARQLYEQLGFTQIGQRPNYYRDPVEDALLLRLFPGKTVTNALEGE
jgi:[ribosomal protein S18]-alanine N-acetyltransferase